VHHPPPCQRDGGRETMERWLGAVLYLVTAGASDVTVVGQAGRPPAGGEDISNSMSRRGRWIEVEAVSIPSS
jgi:hypothetical protein